MTSIPLHVQRLDQALLALLDERARLLAADGPPPDRAAARGDLLRRYDGPLAPGVLHAFLDAVDAACASAGPAGDGQQARAGAAGHAAAGGTRGEQRPRRGGAGGAP